MLTHLLLLIPRLRRLLADEYQRGVTDTLVEVNRLAPRVRRFRSGPDGQLIAYADTRPMRYDDERTRLALVTPSRRSNPHESSTDV